MSWNTHALLTLSAIRSELSPLLGREVTVIPLEEFLAETSRDLGPIVERYHGRLRYRIKSHGEMQGHRRLRHGVSFPLPLPPPARGGDLKTLPPCGGGKGGGEVGLKRKCRFQCDDLNYSKAGPAEEIRTVDRFLDAMRISPQTALHYVRIRGVDEVSGDAAHDPSRSGPPGGSYVETGRNKAMTARDVLCTFSDEPDWGMDQDLFLIEKYGYGEPPYGGASGLSSQAAFHMAFFRENPLLFRLLPRLRLSFMEERIRVFLDLANLAFTHGSDYWGWRFTAWAMHYVQDVTQPYHARAFPFPLYKVFLRFINSGNLATFVEKHQNLLRNRHTLFEAAIHFMLNAAAKHREPHPFLLALADAGEAFSGSLRSVMKAAARAPARLNRSIDRSLVKLMRDPRFDDPTYDLVEDDSYRIEVALADAISNRPREFGRFVELVRVCFVATGKVTRYVIRKVQSWVRT